VTPNPIFERTRQERRAVQFLRYASSSATHAKRSA
jgi:hypothetical protein